MTPDIRIFDEKNELMFSFDSAHRNSLKDIVDHVGPCSLRHVDTDVTVLRKSWILEPGVYRCVASPKRPRFQEEDATTDPTNDGYRRLQKRLDEVIGQESLAVSYADYFSEKSSAGRVEFWTLPVMNDAKAHH